MSESTIQWQHSHDFGVDNSQNTHKVKIVFWLTTVVMVLEIAAGTWSGSMALLADGWHMGTHSAAFLIALFVYSYAKKHANNKSFSFGTGKVNYLGGFASAVALGIVALMMVVESLHRLVEPQSIQFSEAIIVALIGLVVNVVSALILKDNHHHHHGDDGHHHHDHNMKAAYLHVLADTLTSILAIVALVIGKYIGLVWLDPVMGIVGAMVIFHWSVGLIKESSKVLLDKSVDTASLEEISAAMNERNTVINDIHIWKVSAHHYSASICVDTTTSHNSAYFRQQLAHFGKLDHVTLEVNNG